MLAFVLCVENFVLLVIGHVMLEGHSGMDQRTSEHKYSVHYISAFDDCNPSLSLVFSEVGL